MSDITKGVGSVPALHRVILDTDIGSDVDDLLALVLILGTPDIDLVGVTTVYGDTRLRARIARSVLGKAGRHVPVHAGLAAPLSGREVWWAGHEGVLHGDLAREAYDSDDAVRFLVDTVIAAPGEIDVMAIGPLTNIAAAIAADERFSRSVRHLWLMGGSFTDDEPEHNFRSDDVAARTVFASGIPTTVSGLEITRRINIGSDELARIAEAGQVGRLIEAEIEQWWKFWDTAWNVPHDPVTVLTLTRPDLFEFTPRGTISVAEGDGEGVSRFEPGRGASRLAADLDAEAVSAAIVDGIIRGSGSRSAAGLGR